MAGIELFQHQIDALDRMRNGCILNGGVGSGKSRTALAYYYERNGGSTNKASYIRMASNPKDLYIITTARKRDTKDWELEMIPFGLCTNPELSQYRHKVVVDSWNNISKYADVKNSFFIFDEQRVVGYGAWTKSFLDIAKNNEWILLSATPGDKWEDYVPVFIANGFVKNLSEFKRNFIVYNPWTKWPSVLRYLNEPILNKWRNRILIPMKMDRTTVPHHIKIVCEYNKKLYDEIVKNRWNIFLNKPIENATEYCLCLRRVTNSDPSRITAILDILKEHPKVIVFYSYDYELDILRDLFKGKYTMSEWNGHLHEKIISGDEWSYLVQYTAGNEGWNCIETDTIIFYSQNYSYKVMQQACGRIDRLNTPFRDLYYYHLISDAKIDRQINLALNRKKKFNEKGFAPFFTKSPVLACV